MPDSFGRPTMQDSLGLIQGLAAVQSAQRANEANNIDKGAADLFTQMQKDPSKADEIAKGFDTEKNDPRILIGAQNLRTQDEANRYLASTRGKEDKVAQLKLDSAERAKAAGVVKTAFQENASNKYDLFSKWHNQWYPDLHMNNGVNQDGSVTLTPVVPGDKPITMPKPSDDVMMSVLDRAIVGDDTMIQMDLNEKSYIWKANAELAKSTATPFVSAKSGQFSGYHSMVQIDPKTKAATYLVVDTRTNKPIDPQTVVKKGLVTQDEFKSDMANKSAALGIDLTKLQIEGAGTENLIKKTQLDILTGKKKTQEVSKPEDVKRLYDMVGKTNNSPADVATIDTIAKQIVTQDHPRGLSYQKMDYKKPRLGGLFSTNSSDYVLVDNATGKAVGVETPVPKEQTGVAGLNAAQLPPKKNPKGGNKTIVRTGTDKKTGRKVIQYSDNTMAYAD